jgi:hypothetical protein
MIITLLKDLTEDCVDAVIVSTTSTAQDIENALRKMREQNEYYEWDDLLDCLPDDCVVYDKWSKLYDEVYY